MRDANQIFKLIEDIIDIIASPGKYLYCESDDEGEEVRTGRFWLNKLKALTGIPLSPDEQKALANTITEQYFNYSSILYKLACTLLQSARNQNVYSIEILTELFDTIFNICSNQKEILINRILSNDDKTIYYFVLTLSNASINSAKAILLITNAIKNIILHCCETSKNSELLTLLSKPDLSRNKNNFYYFASFLWNTRIILDPSHRMIVSNALIELWQEMSFPLKIPSQQQKFTGALFKFSNGVDDHQNYFYLTGFFQSFFFFMKKNENLKAELVSTLLTALLTITCKQPPEELENAENILQNRLGRVLKFFISILEDKENKLLLSDMKTDCIAHCWELIACNAHGLPSGNLNYLIGQTKHREPNKKNEMSFDLTVRKLLFSTLYFLLLKHSAERTKDLEYKGIDQSLQTAIARVLITDFVKQKRTANMGAKDFLEVYLPEGSVLAKIIDTHHGLLSKRKKTRARRLIDGQILYQESAARNAELRKSSASFFKTSSRKVTEAPDGETIELVTMRLKSTP